MNCKSVETSSKPAWIVTLTDKSREDIKNSQGPVLPVKDDLGFDLNIWQESDKRETTEDKPKKKPWMEAMATLIRRDGMEVRPVICKESWQIVDGEKRLMIMKSIRDEGETAGFIGFELITTQTIEERREYRDRRQSLTQPLAKKEKVERALETLRNHPDYSDRFIGILTGLSSDKIAEISFDLELNGEIKRPEKRFGLDGKYYPVNPKAVRKTKEKNDPGSFEDTNQNYNAVTQPLTLPFLDPGNDEFHKLITAWLTDFGLVSVSTAHITHMMIRHGLSCPGSQGSSYFIKSKDDCKRVGIWLSQVVKQKGTFGDYVLIPTFASSNRVTYQLLPILWVSQSLLQQRLQETPTTIGETFTPDTDSLQTIKDQTLFIS